MKRWIRPIKKMRACEEALVWAKQFATIDEAWAKCERGDWMLWLLGKLVGEPDTDSRKKLVLTVCKCARLALPYVKKGEVRPLKAIETTEAWARGDNGVSLVDVRTAASAAASTSSAAASYAADYADYATTSADCASSASSAAAASSASCAASYAASSSSADCAASAFCAAAYAATSAAYATYASSYATSAPYASYAARTSILKECADIVREYYPESPMKGKGVIL